MQNQQIAQYEILTKIASGGQATVYQSRDTQSGTIVALKVLHPHLSEDSELVERFVREARMAATVTHPNIVHIHEVGVSEGSHFIAMEYLPLDLGHVLKQRGPLPFLEAVGLITQIAKALEAAHKFGIIHRDVKPQNILLTDQGIPKVADFGIARAAEFSTMTPYGTVLGTPQYMSPEQSRGENVDPRSDIYSLGVILFEMLTGRTPLAGASIQAVMNNHANHVDVPTEALDEAKVPEDIASVIKKLLSNKPADRLQNAGDLVIALNDIAASREGISGTSPDNGYETKSLFRVPDFVTNTSLRTQPWTAIFNTRLPWYTGAAVVFMAVFAAILVLLLI